MYNKGMKKICFLLLITSFLLFISCKSEDSSSSPLEEIERPNMKFEEVNYLMSSNDFSPITLTAKTMELYSEKNLAVLEEASFVQKTDDGTIITQGSAQKAEVNTQDYSIVLSGQVQIERPVDHFSLIGSDFVWLNKLQRITTDKEVLLLYDNKGQIKAEGLTCDFKTSSFEFDYVIEGRLSE